MAALVRKSPLASRRANRAVLVSNQPLPKRRVTMLAAAVKATLAGPVVLAGVVAPATNPGKAAYFRYSGAKPWSRAVLEALLPAERVRALFPCGGSASDAFGYVDLFQKIVVADANADIINAHKWVVAEPEKVIQACTTLFAENGSHEGFDQVRAAFRVGTPDSLIHAAQYIYLQLHNSGGISRYSKKSGYNACYAQNTDKNGSDRKRAVPAVAIRRFAKRFAKAGFVHANLLATLAKAGKGDVVFLDPPYRPGVGQKSTHVAYTKEGFTLDDYTQMVKAVEAAARRGATIFVHDHDTTETRSLHGHCTELLPVLVQRKNGKKPVKVAEAVFIYRPVVAHLATAQQKIEVAPVTAANDQSYAEAFNECGMVEEPKLAVAFAAKHGKAEATLWAHPVAGKYVGGFEMAFFNGECQSETLLPSKHDQWFDTASQAIADAANRLLASVAAKYGDLTRLIKAEAANVRKVQAWTAQQIELAQAGEFDEKPAEPVFTYIDLFGGVGGFHLALDAAGGRCVMACEINPEARETYAANFDMRNIPFHTDITTLDSKDVPAYDVLVAGFPCPAFSISGRKGGFDDPSGRLIEEVFRIVKDTRPKLILLENVLNFNNGNDGQWSRIVRRKLAAMGYAVSGKVLNSADFGTAQERNRVFYVAYRRDAYNDIKHFVLPVGNGVEVCVADIIEADAPASGHDIKDMVAQPTIDKNSPFRRLGQMHGRRGQDARVYDISGHAATLMAKQQNCGMYLVNGQPRPLTTRERARLQGFPETFKPHPMKTHANTQFGNSVAVPVVAAIAEAMVNVFFNHAA